MDIHKPKPWHGVREFGKELLTVVVGVLIALAAEQGVEWLHWRHAVLETREQVAADERFVLRIAGEREGESACLARQFADIRAILDRAAASGRLEPVAALNGPTREAWTILSFEPAVSGQVLPHMDVKERGLLTEANFWSEFIQRNRDEEDRAWAALRPLEGPGRPIGEAELGTLRTALATAIAEARIMRGGARSFAGTLVATGRNSPEAVAKAWRAGLASPFRWPCQPQGSDRDDTGLTLKWLQQPLNEPPPPRVRAD
jgi:hypothetical protein